MSRFDILSVIKLEEYQKNHITIKITRNSELNAPKNAELALYNSYHNKQKHSILYSKLTPNVHLYTLTYSIEQDIPSNKQKYSNIPQYREKPGKGILFTNG